MCLPAHRLKFQTARLHRHTPAISPRNPREFCLDVPSPGDQRAQGMPGAQCARSLVCEIKKHTSKVTTVTPETPGIPRAMVLTVSFALSPVTGLVCHRHQRKLPLANLTPASGRQDHTTSPSAKSALSSLAPPASTASHSASVTIAIRPSVGETVRVLKLIWVR